MAQYLCCGIQFDGEDGYLEHRQRIHGEQLGPKHSCCGISFFTDEGYHEHRQKLHGESPTPSRPAAEVPGGLHPEPEGVAPR